MIYCNPLHYSVVTPPVILDDPASMMDVIAGSLVTLTVEARGIHLAYSWERSDRESLIANPRVEGVNTSQLQISDVDEDDAAGYVCEVTNAAGTARSREAIVFVSK